MRPGIKRYVRLLVGWGFIVLGIAGLFLPVLQGILFLLIGLITIAPEYAWADNLLQKLRARFPRVFDEAHRIHTKVEERLHRHAHRQADEAQDRSDHVSH